MTDIKHLHTDSQSILKNLTTLSPPIITSQQHSMHLILQLNFLTESAELMRRELATANAVVSNELNQAKKIRVICFQLLSYLIDQLESKAINLKKAEAFEKPSTEANAKNITVLKSTFHSTKIPSYFLHEILKRHVCRCPQSESEGFTAMLNQVKRAIREEYIASLSRNELQNDLTQ